MEAQKVCCEKNKRVWWYLGLLTAVILTITGGGITLAITDHSDLQATKERIHSTGEKVGEVNKRMDRLEPRLVRIEDKLDRALQQK